jgi:hypothetical protein
MRSDTYYIDVRRTRKGKDMADGSKISVQLMVDRDLHAWLVQEAKQRRSSLAYVIRMLIVDAMKASGGERYGKDSSESQRLHASFAGDDKR